MNKDHIIARIDDWEGRLNTLFGKIETWYSELPPNDHIQFLKEEIPQRNEEPMRQFGITPRKLPTRSVIYGKNRVSFVPSALWIVGANGRVNVTTNRRQFSLVDMGGGPNQQSDWQIVTSHLHPVYVPFDQDVFNDLVQKQLVQAA